MGAGDPPNVFVAQVHSDGRIDIYHNRDQNKERPISVIEVSPGASLRRALQAAGWKPTGHTARPVGTSLIVMRISH
jgi:hypothetical protein